MDRVVVLKSRGQNVLVNPSNVTHVEASGSASSRIFFTSGESIGVDHEIATTRDKLHGN